MATAGNGKAPYDNAGAGGKFRKKPFRRNVPAKPYDRPPTTALKSNNPSLITKLVDPASRLIYAGAHKLFGAFRNRLPSLSLQAPPEVNVESQNVTRETGQIGNSVSISAATGISDLEQMLQQKTFTSSEVQRLTALLHSKTTESPSNVAERDGAKPFNSPSSLLRLEASTSGSLKKHENERDNRYASFSTPIVSSKVFEEDIASPAELAKAYMGYKPTKVAPSAARSDLKLHNNAVGPAITSMGPKTTDRFKGHENGFVTPRSRGRSAMYSMARTPYARSPSNFTQKGIGSSYGYDAALTSSKSAFVHEGKMALKRRSSVLDDDIGSGGPLRRTRQKANLLSQRDKRELGYTALQQPDTAGQKLLLMNGPEPKVSQGYEKNRDTNMYGSGSGSGSGSGYASIPTKSTQTATKILQHLEKSTSKDKESGSTTKSPPNKLTLDMLQGQALRSLEKVDSPKLLSYPHDSQKPDVQPHARLHDSREVISKGKEKVEENGPRKFPIPRNMLTSVNGGSSVTIKDNAPIVKITDSPPQVQAEPPQKKRAFQMSAPDDSFEMDDDEIHDNGHTSFPLVENNKPETSLVTNKPVSAAADVIKTPTVPEVSVTPASVENNKSVFPEVAEIPKQPELKEVENDKFSSKTDFGVFGGSVSEQGIGFKLPTSTTPATTTQTSVPSTFQTEKVSLEKDSSSFSLGTTAEKVSPFAFSANVPLDKDSSSFSVGTTAEKVSPFAFSANVPSEFKPNASTVSKAVDSASLFTSVTKNDHVKDSASNKNENGTANIFAKSESLPSAISSATSMSGSFLFNTSTNNLTTPNSTPVSTALIFPSFTSTNNSTPPNSTPVSTAPAFPSFTSFPASDANTNTNSLSNNSSPIFTSASTPTPTSTTTTTTAANSIFSTSVSPPLFGFGSATSTSAATTSVAENGNTNITNEKEPKSIITSSPFAITSFATTTTTTAAAGSSLFGFSAPTATSTTSAQSQGSFFNLTNGSQATTQTVPFQFGSSPSFGVSSMAASSEAKSGNFSSGPATSVFGSSWQAPQSSGFGSTPSSVFSFGASSTPTPSTTTPPATGFFATAGATNSSFATPSQSQPSQHVFGNSTPVFGMSPNNNDQMSMEDSMAEDSMQTPSPTSLFGQTPVQTTPAAAPGFMFGSANPVQTQPPGGYQFGGQPNQTPQQNPFQSSSVEFNGGGGSFSLGSGGDKAGRRIVRVKKQNRRK